MARSTYYYHSLKLQHPDKDKAIKDKIYSIYHLHKGRYGYRRITLALHNDGYRINHKAVERLMQQMGLKSQVRKIRYRSYRGEVGHIAPNVLQRDFMASAPNCKWATDVTQITIGNKKCYLSPILDMYNGEIISYTIAEHPHLALVINMLKKAFKKTKSTQGLVLHSDQGWQYQHCIYQKMLKEKGIIQSMSRKGNCLDNAVMENFFGIMKSELLYLQKFESIQEFQCELIRYIRYYNNDRIKLKLKGMSPVKFRAHYSV